MSTHTSRQSSRIAAIKTMLETPSKNALGAETIGGCMDFVAAYRELGEALPIDPVALVMAYEKYQDQLADEAAGIEWLPSWLNAQLIRDLRTGVEDSAGIIGCEKREAADSMALWCRGVINRIARGMSKW